MMEPTEINKKIAVSFAETGIGGYDFCGDFAYTDFLPQLQWPKAGKVYEEMSKNDPTIGAVLFMAKQLVRRAEWRVVPGGSSPRDKEAADFVASCMNDMEHSWNEFIGEALTMMPYGWSFHEVVYKMRKGKTNNKVSHSRYSDGKIGWRKFACRSQRTCYGWEIDQENGEILAFKQQAAPDYRMRIIPIDKAIHFKTENDYGSPYGRSMLRNTYRPWFFKKRIEEIEGIGIERDLAGLPVLTPPEGIDLWDSDDPEMIKLKNASETLVKSIRRDQSEGVAKPFGWTLELLSTGSRRQFDTNEILNRYDQRIAITMLADIVMLGADKVGSFALADVKKSLLSAALETLMDCMSDAINRQEVPRLMDINGFQDLEEYPKIMHDEVETPSIEQLAGLLKAMTDSGMDVKDPQLEEFVRKIASLPCSDPEVLELKEKMYKESMLHPEKEEDPEQTEIATEEESELQPEDDSDQITKGACGRGRVTHGASCANCDELGNCFYIKALKEKGQYVEGGKEDGLAKDS